MKCSQCEEPAEHHIVMRDDDESPPPPDAKDLRSMYIIRFCGHHWADLKRFLKEGNGT
jgi:hypothetical protein